MSQPPKVDPQVLQEALSQVMSSPSFLAQISSHLSSNPLAVHQGSSTSTSQPAIPGPSTFNHTSQPAIPGPSTFNHTSQPAIPGPSTSNLTSQSAQPAIQGAQGTSGSNFTCSSVSLFGKRNSSAILNLQMANKKRKNQIKEEHSDSSRSVFFRNVILLTKCDSFQPVAKNNLTALGEKKLFIEGVRLNKRDDHLKVKERIYDEFPQLSHNVPFTILVKSGPVLRPLFVKSDDDINGEFLWRHKADVLYVQPEVNIEEDSDDNTDSENDFLPKSLGKKIKKPSSDFLQMYTPRSKPSEQEYHDGSLTVHDGHVTYTEPGGTVHILTDHKVESRRPVRLILLSVKSKMVFQGELLLEVRRSHCLQDLIEGLQKENGPLTKKPKFTFVGEAGIGKGATREVLSVAMKDLKESLYLEGNAFSKTLKFNVKAYRNKEYKILGAIMALSLLNEGPAPAMFTNIVFELLLFGECRSEITLSDVQNAHIRNEMLDISNAQTIPDINSKMANSSLFELAGTDLQVSGPDFKMQRDRAVKDVLHYYCILRISNCIDDLRMGLELASLFTSLKQAKIEEVEALFIHKPKSLKAQDLLDLFVADAQTKGNRIYGFWERYLNDVEAGGRTDPEITLEKVLFFGTGVGEVPPMGFVITPTLKIRDQTLAHAKSCFGEIYLPNQAIDYDNFCLLLDISIDNREFLGAS